MIVCFGVSIYMTIEMEKSVGLFGENDMNSKSDAYMAGYVVGCLQRNGGIRYNVYKEEGICGQNAEKSRLL